MMSQILTVAASSAPSWSFLSRLWGSLTVIQWAAVVAAAILTLGAVFEYWLKIKLLILLGVKYLIGRSTSFDRCVFRKTFIHSIGPILVVLGIAGEVVFEGRAFILEDRQESANELEATRLRKKAEDEHAALVKIEARVAWRRLSKEQQSVVADNLKQFPGMRVGISYLGGIPEASQFADDIAAALHAARWNIYPLEPFSLFGGFGGGVYPLHPSTGVNVSTIGEKGREASEAIQRELCSIGFDTAVTPKPPVTKPDGTEPTIDVVVLVVARPVASQGATQLTINAKTKACTASE